MGEEGGGREGDLAMWPGSAAEDGDKYWKLISRRCTKEVKKHKLFHSLHHASPFASKTSSIGLILRCTAKKLPSQNKITALPRAEC